VDKVALRQNFCHGVLRCFPVSIIPTKLITHLYVHFVLARTKRRSMGTFQKEIFFQKSGTIG